MIVTVSDESDYLFNVTKYMILSLNKYMPKEKVILVIVNGSNKFDKEIYSWHSNIIIENYYCKINKNKSYFAFMALPLYDLLCKYDEDLIYLDGDIVIKKSFKNLFDTLKKVDLLIRYRPFLNFKGPLKTLFGARVNSGVVAISNNEKMKEFTKEFKSRIIYYLNNKYPTISWNKDKTLLTGIDQELLWILVMEYINNIKFFPLNDIYNDSYFNKNSLIWHAKGSQRNAPQYKIECYKYGKKDVNIIKEYSRLYYFKLKKMVKSFLIEPEESYYIKELEDILSEINIDTLVIVNSNFYLDNKIIQQKKLEVFDTDPVIYYKNRDLLKSKNIYHKYIIFDTEKIKSNFNSIDLLIYEKKNTQVLLNVNVTNKIEKN